MYLYNIFLVLNDYIFIQKNFFWFKDLKGVHKLFLLQDWFEIMTLEERKKSHSNSKFI